MRQGKFASLRLTFYTTVQCNQLRSQCYCRFIYIILIEISIIYESTSITLDLLYHYRLQLPSLQVHVKEFEKLLFLLAKCPAAEDCFKC